MNIKKIGALVLAGVMVLGMSVNTMAGTMGANGTATGGNEVTIPKTINLINDQGGEFYSPAVTYTYEILPAIPYSGASVTDSESHTTVISEGVADGLLIKGTTNATTGSVEFTSTMATYTSGGSAHTQNLTLVADPTKFQSAGIYRYKLTDTTTDQVLYNAGIVRQLSYDNEFFVDVYIINGNSGLEVSGYVMTNDNILNATKVAAFSPDSYKTYNINLKKLVEGSMGDKTNEFEFSVEVNNQGLGFLYEEQVAEHAYVQENAKDSKDTDTIFSVSNNNLAATVALKDRDIFYLCGLSPKATVNYIETNNTSDTYSVKIGTGNSSDVGPNGTKALIATNVTDYDTENASSNNTTINTNVPSKAGTLTTGINATIFTNSLNEVSPTGVALRFAPYIIMTIVATFLLIIARRKKDNKDTGFAI